MEGLCFLLGLRAIVDIIGNRLGLCEFSSASFWLSRIFDAQCVHDFLAFRLHYLIRRDASLGRDIRPRSC